MASIGLLFKKKSKLTADQLEKREGLLAAVNATVLGLAAVATAFAAYRSAILGGDALKDYTKAIRAVSDSNQAYTEASQLFAMDQQLFIEYVKAAQTDTDLALYIRDTLMSDELKKGIEWWEKQPDDTGPETPFVDENPDYKIEAFDAGEEFLEETESLFASGERADDRGDRFDLAVAILATALFLYGISAVSRRYGVQIAALLSGTAAFIGATVYMTTI